MEMFLDLHFDKELSLLSDCSTGGGALIVVALAAVALIHGRAVFGSACSQVRGDFGNQERDQAIPLNC